MALLYVLDLCEYYIVIACYRVSGQLQCETITISPVLRLRTNTCYGERMRAIRTDEENTMTYIHPANEQILDFSVELSKGSADLETICNRILEWFDENVAYSRLNAPFFPLQRSDLDLLEMKAGTCGDYANLIVSVLQALGFDACYAYVHRDCYGDAQDHICAAVKENSRAILIDATLPYRKWHGFDCPHRDYELLSADDFERRMKKEESYWQSVANEHHMDLLAGLLYAPWIHDERIFESDDRLDTAFFLLSFGKKLVLTLYVYYQHYTEQTSSLRVMATITRSETLFYFSVCPHDELWDDTQ